jgi:ribosomal protein S18
MRAPFFVVLPLLPFFLNLTAAPLLPNSTVSNQKRYKETSAAAPNKPTVAQPASEREVEAAVAKLFSSTLQALSKRGLAPPPESASTPIGAAGGSDNLRLRQAEVRLKARLEEIAAINEHQFRHLVDKYNNSTEGPLDASAWVRRDSSFLAQGYLQAVDQEAALLRIENEASSNMEMQAALEAQEENRMRLAGINPDQFVETKDCLFCSDKRHQYPLEPMNIPLLNRFMNTSGKIMGRHLTGLCRKHQSKVTKTIKWARSLNIVSYKRSVFSINNPFKSVDTHYEPVPVNRYEED